ncbi:unnamed protein product [Musa textilis]
MFHVSLHVCCTHPLGWIWDCLVLFFCCNGDRVAFPASSAKSSILRFSGGFS